MRYPENKSTKNIASGSQINDCWFLRRNRLIRMGMILALAGVILFSPVARVNRVAAQEGSAPPLSLTITPASAYTAVEPGKSTGHSITITNASTTDVFVTTTINTFAPDGKTGQVVLGTEINFPYITNPAALDPFTLKPTQSKKIGLTFSPPADAMPQEHHLTFLFTATSATVPATGISSVSSTIGSNLVMWIGAPTPPTNQLKLLSLQRPWWQDSLRPLTFTPLVHNGAPQATIASGSATVSWFGREVSSQPIYSAVILADSSRELFAAIPNEEFTPPVPGKEPVPAVLPQQFSFSSPFLIGRYTVTLHLQVPSATGPLEKTEQVDIWAFPLSLLVLAGIASIMAGIFYRHKQHQPSL